MRARSWYTLLSVPLLFVGWLLVRPGGGDAPVLRGAAPVGLAGPPAPERLVAGGRAPTPEPDLRVRRETVAMGTRLVVTVDAPSRAAGLRAAEGAVRAVERLEGLLSTWDTASGLSRVNAAPVGEVRIPPAGVARLLAEAERWARRTDRAFEPGVGALIVAWDLRGSGRTPDAGSLDRALRSTGPRGVRVDPRTGAVTRLRRDAWIDAGAFGKGAALAAAREALRAAGIRSASLDLGGQVVAVGPPPSDSTGWAVGVAHPSHRDRAVATLRLRSVSAATSGASERGVDVGGERLGHVVDPRTGRPVPPWGSVTVVSSDPLEADVLATALFVLGPDLALAHARERPGLAVLVLEPRGESVRARWTPAMERWLVDVPGRFAKDPYSLESSKPQDQRIHP